MNYLYGSGYFLKGEKYMERKLPWAELTTPVYTAIGKKERKAYVTVYAWFCVCVLVACAFLTKYHIPCAIIAVLLTLAIIVKRTDAVTERGFESFIDVKLFSSHELWPWDEIEAVTWETNPDVPDSTLLYFTHNEVRTRKAFFKNEDVVMIKVLAKKKNKKINIYDGNEYRAEARAFNASQKRRRK